MALEGEERAVKEERTAVLEMLKKASEERASLQTKRAEVGEERRILKAKLEEEKRATEEAGEREVVKGKWLGLLQKPSPLEEAVETEPEVLEGLLEQPVGNIEEEEIVLSLLQQRVRSVSMGGVEEPGSPCRGRERATSIAGEERARLQVQLEVVREERETLQAKLDRTSSKRRLLQTKLNEEKRALDEASEREGQWAEAPIDELELDVVEAAAEGRMVAEGVQATKEGDSELEKIQTAPTGRPGLPPLPLSALAAARADDNDDRTVAQRRREEKAARWRNEEDGEQGRTSQRSAMSGTSTPGSCVTARTQGSAYGTPGFLTPSEVGSGFATPHEEHSQSRRGSLPGSSRAEFVDCNLIEKADMMFVGELVNDKLGAVSR